MPDQTEENADGQVTIKMYRAWARTSWADAATYGLCVVLGVTAVLGCLAWFIVLPVIGLMWTCGWLL